MSKRRQDNEMVKVKRYNSPGFLFGVIQPETEHPDRGNDTESIPCMLDCSDSKRREWANVFLIHGNIVEEAQDNLRERRFSGALYHISECRMEDP